MSSIDTPAGWLDLAAAEFRASYERRPFTIRHALSAHPLFAIDRLVRLTNLLPTASIEFNRADIPLNQEYLKTPKTGLTVAQTLERIEDCRSWVVLKNVEQDDEYRQLLGECVEELRPLAGTITPGICRPEAFIFVSSPQAVTPYHCDPEHNFLLQVRGRKRMGVFDRNDGAAISPQHLEAMANGAHRNLPYNDALAGRGQVFILDPRVGLHVPMHCPHWVRVDESVSVSFSVTFRSRASARREAILRFNSRLRRRGVAPAMPGSSALGDGVKFFAERVIQRVQRARAG